MHVQPLKKLWQLDLSVSRPDFEDSQLVLHHEVSESPERVQRGPVVPVGGEPVGREPGLVSPGVLLGGIALAFPVGHGLAVG